MTVRRVLSTFAVAVVLAALLFPLYWMMVASLRPDAEIFAASTLLPRTLILDHYRALFESRDFWTPVRNSLIVAGATTMLSVSLGTLCAYALARLQFRGKTLTLASVLAVSMFPQISIVSPLYLLLRELRLINTYPGLVLPYLSFAMPLTIWLLVGCPNIPCGRGVLICVPSVEPWARLDTGDDGMLLAATCVLPRPERQPTSST